MRNHTIQKFAVFTTLGLMPLFAIADFATWTDTSGGSVGGISFSVISSSNSSITNTTSSFYNTTRDPDFFSPTLPVGTELLNYDVASSVSVAFSRATSIYLNLVTFRGPSAIGLGPSAYTFNSSPTIFSGLSSWSLSGNTLTTSGDAESGVLKFTDISALTISGGGRGYQEFTFYIPPPSQEDTQASLSRQASSLRGVHNISSLISHYPNSATYDCNLFDVKGMCISAGGRYSTVDNPSSNSSAAVVTLGYKVNSNIRIGGFLDQSVNNNNPTGINLSNKNPMMGAFAYWNQNPDGLGYQVKIANAYQDKDLSTTRDVIGTSEAGRGTTSLNSRSYVGELSYAFMYKENTLVRPYFALRHTSIEQDAYTETGVTTPLTYSALNNRTTSALMGVKFKYALTPKTNLIGSLGVEQDLHNKTDRLTATGIAGLTSENLASDLHRTRPVASIGATYDVAKTQRFSGEVLVQQLPFQSTAGATAYFNYMIGF
jgi:hypothetical protein